MTAATAAAAATATASTGTASTAAPAAAEVIEQLQAATLTDQSPAANNASDDEDETGAGAGAGGESTGDKTKKKKKKKKSKTAKNAEWVQPVPEMAQTEPPTIGINKMYPGSVFPRGECVDYQSVDDNLQRETGEEKRARERLKEHEYNDMRRAAEVHRQVRAYAQKIMKPGMSMMDIVEAIENGTRTIVQAQGLKCGIGFPTGVSLNHCAAHWTPNPGDKTVLGEDDICKVDFGVHVNGRIIDSAFTVAFNPEYDNLIQACKDATNTGVRLAGIDARMSEIGTAIQETMESYEVEIKGKTYPVRVIRNLTGHSIEPYRIHGGKSVPIVRNNESTRMEEGEVYAIETFGSTGRGIVIEGPDCSHYMLNHNPPSNASVRLPSAKKLHETIQRVWKTLPFCRRYLDREGETQHFLALKALTDARIVEAYPPLVDIKGSYTAQSEHTILLRPTQKEILSRGDDY
ncbi:peptidase M24A, methionine aminopeptidase [Ramicandelaber brevisporus]|nr:peptidase M24A, methionine aminopeptidase [Ramicandelaber brevisporus]